MYTYETKLEKFPDFMDNIHRASQDALLPWRQMMPASRMYSLLMIAIVVSLGAGLVWANTTGVSILKESHVEFPTMMAQAQPSPPPAVEIPPAQPARQPQDNTALWIALISSLAINFFNLVNGMFNTWMAYITKRDIDQNTAITKNTNLVARNTNATVAARAKADKADDDLADRSNNK